MNSRASVVVAGYSLGLLLVAGLRLEAGSGNVLGSLSTLATPLYVMVTAVAAVLLMRLGTPLRGFGFRSALPRSRILALVAALLLQALIFGLVHAYQGPVGIAATMSHGLILGALTLAARGTIWPAALAHGFSNTVGLLLVYLDR
jgi:membrane protease YdiL (CAAX protease family)